MAEKKKKETTRVVFQTEIADDIYDMWIETDLATWAKPGQFICVYPHNQSTLLPRPISICETDREREQMRIVYRAAGVGTREFAEYHIGTSICILGNLGNGFPLEATSQKKVVLMGGGIGIPPMLELAKRLSTEGEATSVTVVLGYRNDQLFLKEELEKYATVYVATEDGSVGTKGNVMDAMEAHQLQAEVIMACGPLPMLRAIKGYAKEREIEAYLSLEERMACGVGACLGCVCKTKEKDAHSHVKNARICTDGPVFRAEDVEI
ncbi:MAG: dihydroorotate dehydrogenase electron transfer subunit [Lachnospiraceae bacterium]|nr:dihydroorotate dehydrogenase electron transfer subunit [Lachnospiraceae bacterium]